MDNYVICNAEQKFSFATACVLLLLCSKATFKYKNNNIFTVSMSSLEIFHNKVTDGCFNKHSCTQKEREMLCSSGRAHMRFSVNHEEQQVNLFVQ